MNIINTISSPAESLIGMVIFIIAIIGLILWLFLPFIVFDIKRYTHKTFLESKKQTRLLDKIFKKKN